MIIAQVGHQWGRIPRRGSARPACRTKESSRPLCLRVLWEPETLEPSGQEDIAVLRVMHHAKLVDVTHGNRLTSHVVEDRDPDRARAIRDASTSSAVVRAR